MREFLIFFSSGVFIILSLVVSGVVMALAGVGMTASKEYMAGNELMQNISSFSLVVFPIIMITNVIIIAVLLSIFPKKKVEGKK